MYSCCGYARRLRQSGVDGTGRHALPQKGSVIVYLLENQVNKKCYVGQTRYHTLSRRWSPSLKKSPNPHFAVAIRKYGPKAFTRTILAHASCQAELDTLERFFILIYQTTDRRFGYNQQPGGLVGGKHSPETIHRIRESNKRRWVNRTPEQMLLYSENARLRWDMWPKERKEQWIEASRERWRNRSPEERKRIRELIRQRRQGQKPSVPPWNKGLLGWNTGFRHTAEAKEKVSMANKGRRWGPQSPEHRKRRSEAMKMYHARKKELPPKKPSSSVRTPGQIRLAGTASRREARTVAALKEVEQAQGQLREVRTRLTALKFELQGGCLW